MTASRAFREGDELRHKSEGVVRRGENWRVEKVSLERAGGRGQ